jgi:hypothetical protein
MQAAANGGGRETATPREEEGRRRLTWGPGRREGPFGLVGPFGPCIAATPQGGGRGAAACTSGSGRRRSPSFRSGREARNWSDGTQGGGRVPPAVQRQARGRSTARRRFRGADPSGPIPCIFARRPQGGGGGRRWSDRPREEEGPFVHRLEARGFRRKCGDTREEEKCRRFCHGPREEVGAEQETQLP